MRLSANDNRHTINTDSLPEGVRDALEEDLGAVPAVVEVVDFPMAEIDSREDEWWWWEQEEYDHQDTGLDCNDYIEAMASDVDGLPPIILRGNVISDGNHRFEAYRRAGRATIPAIVLPPWDSEP